MTCVGAKSAVHEGSYRLGVYDELGGAGATAALARDLRAFVGDRDVFDADFAAFVAVFEGAPPPEGRDFEARLCKQPVAARGRRRRVTRR